MKKKINNLKDIWLFIQSDYVRYGKTPSILNITKDILLGWNHSFTYCFWLRLASKNNLFFPFAKYEHQRLSRKYAIQIYPSTKIGYGLCLGHGINIVINPTTIIGNNCNLCHNTTIGSNHGMAAVIGDNVYIGPNVVIVEDVKIGNQVTIGAGSIVIDNLLDNTTVAGNPAKAISVKSPGRYVQNRFEEHLTLPQSAPLHLNNSNLSCIDKFIYIVTILLLL